MSDCVITVLTEDDMTPSQIPFTVDSPITCFVNLSANVNTASKGTLTFCYMIRLLTSICFPGGTMTKVCWFDEYVVSTALLNPNVDVVDW